MHIQRNILIAGGSGFLGTALAKYFTEMGHTVKILTRTKQAVNQVQWNGRIIGKWTVAIEWADVLINLTGKSVDCRYTPQNKAEILSSRLDSTAILAQAVSQAKNPPAVWLNSSSATIYVHSEHKEMTEDEGIIGDDFSMNVCREWEKEFFKHDLQKTRRVALRTSIVLGNKGGAFPKMKSLTKCFMGGYQGDGQQYISWIHVDDYCKAVDFIINRKELVGEVNITSPQPVRNKAFMKMLRTVLNRPFGIAQPKWLLELGAALIGTETELLLKSRNVIPEKLQNAGYKFNYPDISAALTNLIE